MTHKKILGLSLAAATALSAVPAMAETKTQELEKRIERLEKSHTGSSRLVQAEEGKRGIVKLSGQVHRALVFADNHDRTRFTSMDNDNSPSFINLNAAQRWGCYTFGATIEAGVKENNSQDGPNFTKNDAGKDFDWRKVDFDVKSHFGTFRLGKGNMISEGTSEIDLSGTSVAASGAGVNWMMGAYQLNRPVTTKNTDEAVIRTVSQVWSSHDGMDRANRVLIETNPDAAAGFSLGVSHATKERSDAALKFAGDFGEFKLQAAVAGSLSGHGDNSRFGNETPHEGAYGHYREVNGSASALHKTGLSLTLAGAQRHYKKSKPGSDLTKDPHMWFSKLGYQFTAMECGHSAIAVNYGQNRHSNINYDKTKTYGVALVQHIEKVGTEVYVASQAFKHKWGVQTQRNPNATYAVVAGARVKF